MMRVRRIGPIRGSLPIAVGPVATKTGLSQITASWSQDSTGADRLLLVAVTWIENPVSLDGILLTNVTYGAQALLPLSSIFTNGTHTELWYVLAPNVGTDLITLMWTGLGIPEGGMANFLAGSIVFENINQMFPFASAVQTTTGSTSPAQVVIPSAINAGGLMASHLSVNQSAGITTVTPDLPMLQVWNLSNGVTTTRRHETFGTVLPGDYSAGPNTLSWTLSVARPWNHQGVELRPA